VKQSSLHIDIFDLVVHHKRDLLGDLAALVLVEDFFNASGMLMSLIFAVGLPVSR
jgi:hypothetical protein